MDLSERRLSYQYQRVLVETTRVLAPQFDDTLICLTGAELELLRNVTTYFHLRSSFVSEYEETYYLCPDDEDWDSIEGVVAGLEEKLMGCETIASDIAQIKGYLAALAFDLQLFHMENNPIPANETIADVADGSSSYYVEWTEVPEDYRMRVYGLVAMDTTGPCTLIRFEYSDGSSWRQFDSRSTVAGGNPIYWMGPIVLEAGENTRVRFTGAANGDNLRIIRWAERFEVPGGT